MNEKYLPTYEAPERVAAMKGVEKPSSSDDLEQPFDPPAELYDGTLPDRLRRARITFFYVALVLLAILALLLSPANRYPAEGRALSSDSWLSPEENDVDTVIKRAAPLLRPFQVYPPVLTPTDKSGDYAILTDGYRTKNATGLDFREDVGRYGCVERQVLMVHTFRTSYDKPFVGPYTPPGCKFNRVTFNVTVTSAGRQFDRLGAVYFGRTELWRTSTAEPTETGIVWTYIKDMTHFLSLFKKRQTLIFDLGNQITDIYTAPYHVTLTATFFSDEATIDTADMILPVSSGLGSWFMVPPMKAIDSLSIPQNVYKAVFTIAATGQIDEEFWYSNVYDSFTDSFAKSGTVLLGQSAFREVQLYIDGMLAGVVWPFPIIFTGGVVPGFWRPVVGIDAFDLREDEIDVTPWLPLLCDGNEHTFEIRIASLQDDGHGSPVEIVDHAGSFWVVTGKLFLWLDPSGSVTKGTSPERHFQKPLLDGSTAVTQDKQGRNNTLTSVATVRRRLTITSTVKSGGKEFQSIWAQNLTYSSVNHFTKYGNTQLTKVTLFGSDSSSSRPYTRHISYPLKIKSSFKQNPKNFTIDATIERSQSIQITGRPVFPSGLQSFASLGSIRNKYPEFMGTALDTTQNGTASYLATNNNEQSFSSGTTQQDMQFSGIRKEETGTSGSFELYTRHVVATNQSVTEDEETLVGRPTGGGTSALSVQGAETHVFAFDNIRRLLGRGPIL